MANKKALLVGINAYKNPSFNLRGCLNDVASFAEALQTLYGFEANDITFLRDSAATGPSILQELKRLFVGAGPGDVLVFGYSGHGTEVAADGDDSIREAIVPHETTTTAALITNRDLNQIVRAAIEEQNLKDRINFTAVYDCCHSGKMFRDLSEGQNGELVVEVINRVLDLSDLLPELGTKEIEINDTFQVFSACRHDETAADMAPRPENGLDRPRGAFSFVLHNLIRKKPAVSVNDLDAELPGALKQLLKRHEQVPVFAVQDAWRNRPIFTI